MQYDALSVPAIYRFLEDDLGISVWDAEESLTEVELAAQCERLTYGGPVAETYYLAHCLFGNPEISARIPELVLERTDLVCDGTHPFVIIQELLLLFVGTDMMMEIEVGHTIYPGYVTLFPWGQNAHRGIAGIDARLLDIRGKQAMSNLMARGMFTCTRRCPSTNIAVGYCFLLNDVMQTLWEHWKTIFISIFIHCIMEECTLIDRITSASVGGTMRAMILVMVRDAIAAECLGDREGESAATYPLRFRKDMIRDPCYVPLSNGNYTTQKLSFKPFELGQAAELIASCQAVPITKLQGRHSSNLLYVCLVISASVSCSTQEDPRSPKGSPIDQIKDILFPILISKVYPTAFLPALDHAVKKEMCKIEQGDQA